MGGTCSQPPPHPQHAFSVYGACYTCVTMMEYAQLFKWWI